ncbi:MAG: metallophosphoesterase [Thermosynechococcaceae cyanobacterium MS004]|nr:metallophosphoesterase [Thermosynechococcaceae cyanobacterium MS004]
MVDHSPRRIIIGDVHGHLQGLQTLFSLLALEDSDRVYFLGDLIDRGPESAQVIEFVRVNQYPCLLGNHEQMMRFAFNTSGLGTDHFAMEAWLSAGGRSTLDSYTDLSQLDIDLRWIATLPTYLDLGDLWLVHAGVHPLLPLTAQTAQEFCWIRREFHQTKEPYFADKLIVTGHTITFTFPGVEPGQIVQGAGWLDIDTGAYHPKSGWLTALDFTQQQVFQVNVYSAETRVRPLSEAITSLHPPLHSKSNYQQAQFF